MMNNIFNQLPWSTVRVLKYIVKEFNRKHPVDALKIRNHFDFDNLKEQQHLELLESYGFIDNIGYFVDSPAIYKFRVTAKSLTAFESFREALIIFLLSSFAIPAIVSVITTLITSFLTAK